MATGAFAVGMRRERRRRDPTQSGSGPWLRLRCPPRLIRTILGGVARKLGASPLEREVWRVGVVEGGRVRPVFGGACASRPTASGAVSV